MPKHLGPAYGSQWQDRSMAAAYHHRSAYPTLVFDVLKRLAKPGPVLEIGAGTGDATLELAWRFERVDAVEPSGEMLRVAQRRTGRNIRWIHASFEEAQLSRPYGLAVAAESLHWTDWETSLPKIDDAVVPGAYLALLDRSYATPPWSRELGQALYRYSTNQDFEPYDLVEELRERRLYRVIGAMSSLPVQVLMPVEDYIESFHSRNGLSRERMPEEHAAAFDQAVRGMVQPHLRDGFVPLKAYTQLTWGRPMP
ncbi:MAG: class I SAM-dependent methyltransferase [Planctomycetes bacterium]|nr:class I SAM-dependent methyltransferase [Planctomycetota bacterium]